MSGEETKISTEQEQLIEEKLAAEEPQKELSAEESLKPAPAVGAATPINEDALTALLRRMLLGNWIPFAVLAGIFAALGGLFWAMLEDSALGISVIVAGVLVPAAVFFFTMLLIKGRAKKMPELAAQKVITLLFGDRITGSESSKEAPLREIAYDWDVVQKAAETKDYFFLFVNNRSAIIVAKAGITQGTVQDLKDIFRAKLGGRFKGKK